MSWRKARTFSLRLGGSSGAGLPRTDRTQWLAAQGAPGIASCAGIHGPDLHGRTPKWSAQGFELFTDEPTGFGRLAAWAAASRWLLNCPFQKTWNGTRHDFVYANAECKIGLLLQFCGITPKAEAFGSCF